MEDDYDHEACVNAWTRRAAQEAPSEAVLDRFDQGFAVLWRRAYRPLGDVTLIAIADRVLVTAVEKFPLLSPLEISTTGIQWQRLREHVASLQRDELAAALRFMMVEFLTVLGNLTAQILTPALHSELSLASDARPAETAIFGEPQIPETKREGAPS